LVDLNDQLLDQLTVRLAPHGVAQLRPLAGGSSSLTYAGAMAGKSVVIKVAPPGVAPKLHRDVLRQSRIIRALGSTPVPVPEVLLEDGGDPPEIPPLFVMSMLDGTSVEPLFDADSATEPDSVVAQRFRNAATTMAQLHRIAPSSLDLDGDPRTGPVAEVDRWSRTLETVDPRLAPGWKELRDALKASVPPQLPAVVVHGDFRLGNLLAVGERITAVIDWEIWSLADPRIDAGWFLTNCDPSTYRRDTPYVGVTPAPAQLASIYSRELGRDVPDLEWFQALACFKSVATWSLIVKHNRRRSSPRTDLEAMAAVLPDLLARGRELTG
jgi:aminoglycoside phosphotransferase (APT) family kinase protein